MSLNFNKNSGLWLRRDFLKLSVAPTLGLTFSRLSGLYLAALLGAAQMADIVGDAAFAAQCRMIFETGRKKLVADLFDGEYFINKVDPKHLDAINSGTGCEIEQVFGQSWGFQAGLQRVLPETETVTALKSLWRYNFLPTSDRIARRTNPDDGMRCRARQVC
jgi:uncharacterized protein (DUF608 family)